MSESHCPVLREDGTTMDWKLASYGVEIEVRHGSAQVRHRLRDAPEIEDLIDAGSARFALEVRCPTTQFARIRLEADPSFQVEWPTEEVGDEVFLLPGVVAVEDVTLPAAALSDLWKDSPRAPKGWWLARGEVCTSKPLAASLVEFHPDARLPEGCMSVREDGSGEEPKFAVRLASDVFSRVRRDRDVQMAGLIAAFALLPASERFRDDSGSRVAAMLRDRLADDSVPAWDEDGWDPARAATVIERFDGASGGAAQEEA